jgi:hypothetical protein
VNEKSLGTYAGDSRSSLFLSVKPGYDTLLPALFLHLPPTKCWLQITVEALGFQSFLQIALTHNMRFVLFCGIL